MASSCRGRSANLVRAAVAEAGDAHLTTDDTRFDYLFDGTDVPIVYLTGWPRAPAESGDKVLLDYTPVIAVEEYSPAPWIRYH